MTLTDEGKRFSLRYLLASGWWLSVRHRTDTPLQLPPPPPFPAHSIAMFGLTLLNVNILPLLLLIPHYPKTCIPGLGFVNEPTQSLQCKQAVVQFQPCESGVRLSYKYQAVNIV
jgi:hypothetical protein